MSTDPDVDRFVRHLQACAVGEAKARPAVAICRSLGLEPDERNRRVIRAWTLLALKAGHLVCAGQKGYFVPATPAEVQSTTRRLRGEAYELLKRARRADELSAERFELAEMPEPARETPALLALMETA